MIDIVNVKEFSGDLTKAIQYIHGVWGDDSNYNFYQDAIENSSLPDKALPQFYLMLKEDKIIGCSALITNDFISRHDLYPWMACLYVDEEERGHSYARLLIEYAEDQARKAGFSNIYLTTDHAGYYEKYGWQRIEDGIDLFSDQVTRIYTKKL
ncbi:acetyltransferase (GNAT) family protein [Orenia metallireducens]|uniref:Acetyltransferase (GNAT) family protein n=1 Tax=Orenia metallireducens TaxID=1413210 RepID=A0A285HW68_9FIRM|nr:GNAT family N-acetyltransferase [Orenia metallireducens]PRX29335.1 acetyltransferase (GNAT) family protein [Orenia metallireducens]SNY39955.1 Acetyltransferase (GNAT) family protein [Orenia metallireducens]